ncbi:MAG TPA: BTAD domain-containing putative transcriptional regulator [Streptosporangiaceae bacterium]
MGDASDSARAGGTRGPATVPRPRVTALLAAAHQRRVTLVVAGAGYGKTTALAEVAAMGASRWVRLRPADAQAESLSARIAAALGEPPFPGRSAIAAATGSDDRRVLAERRAALLCELAEQVDGDLLLVVDGVEYAGGDEAASHLLRVLSLEAPPQLHLVLSGRSLPELGLGGAQGRGELLEVTAPDLSFTAGEAAGLVEMRLGRASPALVQECWSLTGGWPAALQLLLDRLERLDPADHGRALGRLRQTRGHPWKAFARELVAGEPAAAQRILAVASLAPRVDAGLLQGVAVSAAAGDLEGLRERGLLVEAGAPGYYRMSPVLADAADHGGPGGGGALREQAAGWLEDHSRLEEALECHADGARDAARSFLTRCGPALIRSGAAARLIEVLRHHGTGGDPGLDGVLAEAWQAAGEWDAAIDLFARVERVTGSAGLSADVAWRYGWLLYLRGQTKAAAATLAAAHDPARRGADDAMVSACLSSLLWSQGQADSAGDLARISLDQAGASGDSCALAAAHVSLALVAASRGERERNEQEYRLALAAARDGGDLVQLARIHANLSSRALENGSYSQAISEAELALETGAGHRFFSGLALANKAEAHLNLGQLDDASTAVADATAICEALGSLHASVPSIIYGELCRQRGDMIRARSSFERARALAEEGDDVHTLVHALFGLARVLAEEDLAAARAAAAEAVASASSLERAAALCAAAEVELWARDRVAADGFARQAETEARATGDRAALAESLELQGAARAPGDQARLRSAIELWDDVGNPVRAARARLGLALLTGDKPAAEATQRELEGMGVAPALGVPGLLASARGSGREVAIAALGRFTVMLAGEPVPLAAWQSRKARDLLKVLVARRGHPITREAAAEAMWPGEDPEPLGNRLSVALSTIRKVLDPGRQHPPDHYVHADARTIALRLDRADVDLAEFLQVADEAIDLMAKGDRDAAEAPLQRARHLYAGDFLEEDLYEDWAVEPREEARSRLLTVLRLLARLAADRGDDESAGQYLGQLLEREPYDEDAWLALIAGQLRLRRHGEARRRYAAYARRMGELDVVPVPLAEAASWRP